MEGRHSSKRRRIINTCSECHRRKQKCNRQKPCNICLARKVPNRCHYIDATDVTQNSLAENEEPTWASEATLKGTSSGLNSDQTEKHIGDQIGYSSMNGSNVFMDLQQILKDEPDLSSERSSQSKLSNDRYWSIVADLPSPAVVNELIEVFFSEVNWYYSLLERHYFDELQKSWLETTGYSNGTLIRLPMKGLPRNQLHFPTLLFQIVAIALEFLPSDASSLKFLSIGNDTVRHCLSNHYSSKGMDIMDILGRYHATLTSVQQDLLRSLWLKVFGRGSESWHALGNAVRQAQELNLHVQSKVDQSSDIGETLSRLWYDEYKKRLWIVLFTWDSSMALVLGRPRIINSHDCDVRLPIDCTIPDDPARVVPTAIEGGGSPPSTISPSIFQYRISQLIHEMKTTGANKRFPRDYSVVQSLHARVICLLDTLPLVLRPSTQNPDTSWDARFPNLMRQREQVLAAGNSFLLGLHRPHAHSNQESRSAAMQAAFTLLDSQQRFFDKTPKNQYRFFGLTFFTVDAGFLLSTLATTYPPTDQNIKQRIHLSLLQGMNRLEVLENVNAIAGSGLKMLRYCYQKMRLAMSLDPVEMVTEVAKQPIIVAPGPPGTTGTTSKIIDRDDHRLATQTSFDALHQPPDSQIGEYADANEFDVSYWIEQMNSISQFPVEDMSSDVTWNIPLE
ncbi:hypothetical protein N431DRAFT_423485 [Stipitochalara longipes BDJ]|nr:hypothetical protein N431DRAFT_423485 [Stipitochalara longipes BDJ]